MDVGFVISIGGYYLGVLTRAQQKQLKALKFLSIKGGKFAECLDEKNLKIWENCMFTQFYVYFMHKTSFLFC